MFRDLQQILRTAGIPLGDEELLDALWLVSRLPEGPDTPLAARLAAAQEAAEHLVEGAPTAAHPTQPGDHLTPPQPTRAHTPGDGADTSSRETIPDAEGLTPLTGARYTGNPADLELRVPGLKALGSDLAFNRALRPLKRRIPSACRTELDEAATAAAQADTRVPQVVLRPLPERWLRLALIIDSAASMLLWERHCTELLAAFERSGAFRHIEVHQLRYRSAQSHRSVALTRPWDSDGATALPPRCVTDPSGRTMVIVVTDGAAPAWHDGRMRDVLKNWATAGPTALIHVLPRHMWAGTGVTGDTWHIAAPRPGAPNTDWHVTHPILPPALSAFTATPIPVIELTPPGLASWATALTTIGHPVPLRLWEPRTAPAPPTADATATAFSRTASPQAVQLAAHLAAMAPVTVPVMQLVHSCLPGSHRTAALAEVFLGGLLKPLPLAAQPPAGIKHRLFDFTSEAKDLLLDTVPATELISCSHRVGERMETLVGLSPDFPAWLLTPSQQRPPADRPHPFAHIGQALLTRLGRATSPDLPKPDLLDHHAAGPHPTAVILTAHPQEYQAVRAYLTGIETLVHAPTGTRAECGRLPGTRWYVALAETGEGALAADTITERIDTWLKPEALFFVGVAGGLKDDIKLGDVVVATKAYGIPSGRETQDGFLIRPESWLISRELERTARHALRGTPYKVHFKPVASGNTGGVDAVPVLADHIRAHYNDAAAIDMESVGLTRAHHLNRQSGALIICGIGDTADNSKPPADARRRAADNAAAVIAAVLRELEPSTAHAQEPQLPSSTGQSDHNHVQDVGSIGRAPDPAAEQPGESEALEQTSAAQQLRNARGDSQNGGVFFHTVIQGRDITVQLPSPAQLSGLPPASPAFTGRERHVQELLAALAPGVPRQRAVLVAGLAGVGKTELVVQTATRALQHGWFPGGVLFVDMFGYDAKRRLSPERALEGLLRALGMPAEHIPADLQDRARLYHSVLAAFAEQGRRILVMIDNAATAEQTRPLLPTDGTTAALLTSRHTLDLDARLHDLDFLDEHASIELLRQTLHQANGPGDTRIQDAPEAGATIARLCAGHPLALRIAATLLTDAPTRPLASFAQALQNANSRLDRLNREDRAVRAAFDLSYQHLDNQSARLFRLLPLNPGPDLSAETVAHLADIDPPQVEELLQDLARTHLIEPGPSRGRWRLHDLVRLYADQQGLAHAEADHREAARARLFEYYQATAQAADTHLDTRPGTSSLRFPDRVAALAWLDAERLNLIATATTAPTLRHPETSTALASALDRYLNYRRLSDIWITVTTTALAVYRETGDRHGEAGALTNLGTALAEMGRLDEAVDAHTTALAVFREIGDRHGEAAAANNLGTALAEARRFDEAITAHTQDLAICRETGDRHGEAGALNNLGTALSEVRRFDEAIDAYTRAAEIFHGLGDPHSAAGAVAEGGAARRAARDDMAREADAPLVAPYAMSGGRTRPRYQLAIEALVSTTVDPARLQGLLPEHQRICHLCREVKSVAEISAILSIPLGVARILVADLAEAGLVAIHQPGGDASAYPKTGDRHNEAGAVAEGGAARRAARDDMAREADAPLVAPYAMSGGRTRPRYQLAIEALVSTTVDPARLQGLLPEHQRICHLCREVKSVAEISAILSIPLGAARILVADLAEAGLVAIHQPGGDEYGSSQPDVTLLERVLSGLRKL